MRPAIRVQGLVPLILGLLGFGPHLPAGHAADAATALLPDDRFRAYVEAFNQNDEELYPQAIRNASAWEFLAANVPRFECSDPDLERTYWFRWWTYRKHLRQTPDGAVITEFLPPVPWAGKHNTISCAAGHHLYEGRWLLDARPLDEYARFWFRGGGDPRRYSFWAADALWSRACVTGDTSLLRELLPDLVANDEGWEKARFDRDLGLYWQEDGQDGMEVSIGGSGARVTLNSYQCGDALAIARIAELAGQPAVAARFRAKADTLLSTLRRRLWDPTAGFYKVLPRGPGKALAGVRELHGFTPWYFGLAEPSQGVAWRQLSDPKGFKASFGLTTAEQRDPGFALSYRGHECQWNGPSWPYATAVTLTAAARFLNGPPQEHLTVRDYFEALQTYARAHRLTRDDGTVVPWIDENLNPHTGDWIARTRLKSWQNGTWSAEKGGRERGKDYNHSTFCDLIISGLVGLHPRIDEVLEVRPLVPDGALDYFALDRVAYHGRRLTIFWDRTGERYHRGAGLRLWVDGLEIAATNRLTRLEARWIAAPAQAASIQPLRTPWPDNLATELPVPGSLTHHANWRKPAVSRAGLEDSGRRLTYEDVPSPQPIPPIPPASDPATASGGAGCLDSPDTPGSGPTHRGTPSSRRARLPAGPRQPVPSPELESLLPRTSPAAVGLPDPGGLA